MMSRAGRRRGNPTGCGPPISFFKLVLNVEQPDADCRGQHHGQPAEQDGQGAEYQDQDSDEASKGDVRADERSASRASGARGCLSGRA